MKRTILYYIACLFAFVSCAQHEHKDPSMVVEGWIDAGGYPVVLLHSTYVMDEVPDSLKSQGVEDIAQRHLIMFGKVVISNGVNEVILTGRLDTLYLPPYSYSSLNLVGQEGMTYRLEATYKEFHASAITTIPPRATFDSVRVKASDKDTLINAYMSHLPQEEAYYALFMRYKYDKQFILCPLGVFTNAKARNGQLEIIVHNPLDPDTPQTDSLLINRPAQIKVARIDYEAYLFWSKYASLSQSKGVFFVPVYENIQGNIRGGLGAFTGMGSTIYDIPLNKDTTWVFP